MKHAAPAPKLTPRQDRKYKRYCKECGKSQRMTFIREGVLCPKLHILVLPQRSHEGLVDTRKESY